MWSQLVKAEARFCRWSSLDLAVDKPRYTQRTIHSDFRAAPVEVPDASARPSQLAVVTANWLRMDPTSAKAWTAQIGIADETRQALHRMMLLDSAGEPAAQ